MRSLHRAAAVRAYRTLATGLGGSVATAATAALVTDPDTAKTAIIAALATTLISAVASFWTAIAAGLPEVPEERKH